MAELVLDVHLELDPLELAAAHDPARRRRIPVRTLPPAELYRGGRA